MIFILKQVKTTEKFTNLGEHNIFPSDRNYKADHVTKVKTKNFTIEMLELNPFFEREIYSFDTKEGEKGYFIRKSHFASQDWGKAD